MKATEELTYFVRDGLRAGLAPEVLHQSMARAGWSAPQIAIALSAWQVEPDLPPVPRPQAYVSAREALVYGLLFISLGTVAWHIVQLGYAVIDTLIVDVGDWQPYPGSLRWSIASLIAFLPMFLVLNRRVNAAGDDDQLRRRSLVRKWFAAITLLIACLVLLGDLVFTLYSLLNGDLTLRFAAKAGLVAVVAVLVLAYYRDEMDG